MSLHNWSEFAQMVRIGPMVQRPKWSELAQWSKGPNDPNWPNWSELANRRSDWPKCYEMFQIWLKWLARITSTKQNWPNCRCLSPKYDMSKCANFQPQKFIAYKKAKSSISFIIFIIVIISIDWIDWISGFIPRPNPSSTIPKFVQFSASVNSPNTEEEGQNGLTETERDRPPKTVKNISIFAGPKIAKIA